MTLTTTSPGYFHFVLHGAENTHNVIAAVVAISKRSTGLTRHGCAHNERLDAPTTLGAFVSSNIRVFCAAGIVCGSTGSPEMSSTGTGLVAFASGSY